MATTTATSLRPLPVKDEVDTSIPLLVQRIIQERGHFKSVTEQNLLDEIAAQEEGQDSDKDLDEVPEKALTLEARRSELALARVDIANYLGRAQNDIGMALDFVSLLLAKDRSEKANLTLSPFMQDLLKGNLASVAFDSFEPPPASVDEKMADTKVALGWNIKGLSDSADALLASATSLEREMKKEAQYWDDVLSISEKGWSLCRIGKTSTIGVRYGFAEAAARFNALGLAALRPSDDGSVKLDQGLRRAPKSLRIQIRQGDRITSKSRVRPCEGEQAPIEAVIRQARDSLFEEELYHEICREARSLLPCGVVIENGTIVAPMDRFSSVRSVGDDGDNRQIMVDLVPRSRDALDSLGSDTTADTIAISLRILMTNVYGQKFRRRTHPPPPLSKDKPQPPVFNLLRPVLSHTFHRRAYAFVQSLLQSVFGALNSANMGPVLEITHNAPELNSMFGIAVNKKAKAKRIERFVASLCDPLSTTLSLALRGQKAYVDIATHLEPPYYGTSFRVSQISDNGATSSPMATFDQPDQVRDYIISLASHLVAASTVRTLPGWQLQEGSATLIKSNTQPAKRRKTLHIALEQGGLALLGAPVDSGPVRVWGVWDGQTQNSQADWDKVLHEATQA